MTSAAESGRKLRIGVFDSGFGGLTVLRALRDVLPLADYIYLGDTARLPYGSKSRETIRRYARSSVGFLLEQGADLLVIACNTATAMAIDDLVAAAAPVPVLGVIEPGARAARDACPAGVAPEVLVLATAATVESHAYARDLERIGVRATEKACPLLVPLVEEGWTEHPVTEEVVTIYLREALGAAPTAGALLLGCTHYPLLRPVLRRCLDALGRPLPIVDSAEATALAVRACVRETGLGSGSGSGSGSGRGTSVFYATDSVAKFGRLGSEFLGELLPEVRLIDLGG